MNTDLPPLALLKATKTIALVGASANPARPSFQVGAFLERKGFKVIGVNPGLAGQHLFGNLVYARLGDIPEPIDMVDIFRNSDAAAEVIDEALLLTPLPKVIWMQIGVLNEGAANKARTAGLTVVMNKCPKIELSY